MKDYFWVILSVSGATLAFIFFIFTLSSTTSIIKKAKKSKLNIMVNISLLLLGLSNVGLSFYLIMSIREQIERLSKLY